MIPAAFDYVRADSADEAVAAARRARRRGQAAGRRPLAAAADEAAAGGAVGARRHRARRGPVLRPRRRRPRRHRRRSPATATSRQRPPRRRGAAAAHAAGQVGDPQVRHRGTIGGSIAHGDPASDLPAVLLALRATLVARGPDGERTIPVDDFFTGFLETALAPTSCSRRSGCRRWPGPGWSFQKFNRRAQDWAIVGCRRGAANGSHGHRPGQHGLDPAAGDRGRGGARRRARRPPTRRLAPTRAPSRRRPQRIGRVPPPPRPGAGPPGAGGGRRLTPPAANLRWISTSWCGIPSQVGEGEGLSGRYWRPE